MAPVVASFVTLLALASAVEAKPLLAPGRHAPHKIANILSSSRRSLHGVLARYYGTAHGLTRPAPLPEKRDVTLPGGWSYFGCVDESSYQRLLQGLGFTSTSMTPTLCLDTCHKGGFTIAGTEYGDECYCGNDYVGTGGTPEPESSCNVPCSGDPTENCGAGYILSLYTYNSTEATSCTPVSIGVSTSTLVAGGALATGAIANGTAAVSSTASFTSSAATATSTTARYENSLDSSEWYSLGCGIDSRERILNGSARLSWRTMTVDDCLSSCEDSGFAYAGVEYGQECYCGNSLPNRVSYSTTQCDMPCVGNATEMCGGNFGIDLYELVTGSDCPANSTTTTGAAAATSKASSATTVAASMSKSTTTVAATASVVASSLTAAPATSTTVPASSDDHSVWAHHMVGNTYPYGLSDWTTDISKASSYGIDGFALNLGVETWQVDRATDAYAAAKSANNGFKLFLSLDMTSLACGSSSDAQYLVGLVKKFASHPNQAMHNGKVLVSTFAGSDCQFGTGSSNGWQNSFVDPLKSAGIPIFFVPSLFSDISTFSSNSWMDGELNWNSGWPIGDVDLSTSSDSAYMAALGSKEYMPAISPFFFTHFAPNSWNKNWLYKGDDWLYCSRWEEVIALRNHVKMTEILTWNDYGESSYIGPIHGALPQNAGDWVNGFDHESINVLTKYYSTAFKTGSYPAIEQDTLIMWTRPHSHDATASSDGTGRPTGWDWTEDHLWAVVMSTGDATVTLTSGSNSQTFTVTSGLTKLKIPNSSGTISGTISRNGATVASYAAGNDFSYTTSPQKYNYNYFLGSSS